MTQIGADDVLKFITLTVIEICRIFQELGGRFIATYVGYYCIYLMLITENCVHIIIVNE